MADAETELDLDALHAGIISAIAARFPSLATVADYHADRTALTMPAVLVELEDFEGDPDQDPGTGQTAVRLRFRARIVIGFRTPSAEREIRKLAAALAQFIDGHRWGQPIERATVALAAPDDFDPDLQQAVVWAVEFEHAAHLGESVWTGAGADLSGVLTSPPALEILATPTDPLVGQAPRIGEGNAAEYQDLTPDAGA